MPNKKIVLCEGIHDVILFSILMDEKGINYLTITHEELSETRERAPETNIINKFLGTKGRKSKFLIKDEGGKPNCIDNFINLIEDKDERYLIFLFLDSNSNTLEKLKTGTRSRFNRDVLDRKTQNYFLTKDQFKHRIYLIPKSLEFQVYLLTGKNLDMEDREMIRVIMKDFIGICRGKQISWFLELETVLFSSYSDCRQ